MLHSRRTAAICAAAMALALVPACSVLFESDAIEGDAVKVDASDVDADNQCYNIDPGCPQDSPADIWQKVDNSCSCYISQFNGDRGTLADGHVLCEANFGAHLLVLETQEEQETVQGSLVAPASFHLGLFHNDQNWQWVTDEILTVGSYSGFPNGGLPAPAGNLCSKFDKSRNIWRENPCSDVDDIVCELDGKFGSVQPPGL
jgi:hypothetical protein